MKKINILFAVLLYLNFCLSISGQDSSKGLSEASHYDSKNPNGYVYLHTDRSYYLPGESVLFKTYFLDDLNNRTFPANDTLHISILDQDGREVASEAIPVDNNMITGNIDLPDVLAEGDYLLIAYTRSMKTLPHDKFFSKIIEIRKSFDSYLNTDLSLSDSVYESGSLLTARIRFSGKDNIPVPANFTYQITGKNEEILSGNNKANSEGSSTLKLQLPKLDGNETLILSVVSSYKGAKNMTGVVIPTHFNYSGKKVIQVSNLSSAESKHLNFQIKALNLSTGKDDAFNLEISATDDKGAPAMANLSVSVSNLIPQLIPSENNNILSYNNNKNSSTDEVKTSDINEYFTRYLTETILTPGKPYLIQEKNNSKKLYKKTKSVNQKSQAGYSSDRNIFDIIMSIKPYRIDNGMIIFGIGTMNSVNIQQGALIIVDGIKMGTDPAILNTIPVPDIARINASTSVMDIQKYSAMNCNGIIEITMKKSKEFVKSEEDAAKVKSNTLFWGPEILTDNSGKASVNFFNNDKSNEVLITVEGITANGLCGSSSIRYSVK